MSNKQIENAAKLKSEGKCVLCKKHATNLRRGLCNAHYLNWRAARKELRDDKARQAFDDMLIKQGRLLPSEQGKRTDDTENPFARSLAEFLAEWSKEE